MLQGGAVKKIVFTILFTSLVSQVNIARADYIFYLGSPNACANLANNWLGQGRVYNWVVDCQYHGIGIINNRDQAGNFQLNINVNKDSGSFICPNTYSSHFTGKCSNGYVVIATGYGDLAGTVSGNAGTAKGSLTISGTKTNVDITFNSKN